MKSATISSTAKTTKSIAQGMAKQIAQEPLEMLKSANRQVSPFENRPSHASGQNESQYQATSSNPSGNEKELKEKVRQKDTRLYEALQRELDEIGKQRLYDDLQRKIASGQEVSLYDLPLTPEQVQVLRAQLEVFQARQQQQKVELNQAPKASSKPSRRFLGFGVGKKQAERQQTRVEKPLPPSG